MLYYGCGNWDPIPKKTLKSLNKFTITYLRVALGLGKKGGCRLPSLYWQTGTMLPENYILYQKLLFLHHLATLPNGSLAKDFYLAQKLKKYPGIVTHCEDFLNQWNISNVELFTKYQWKKVIRDKIYHKNRDQILNWCKSYKKLDYNKLSLEKFEMKSYFKTMNISKSRLFFKVQSLITPTVRINFKSDKKFKSQKWICTDCMEENIDNCINNITQKDDVVQTNISSHEYFGFTDSQEHLMLQCRANEDLRMGKDVMGNNKDCVTFFQQLIQRRLDKLN